MVRKRKKSEKEKSIRVVGFYLADEEYGVEISQIRSIERLSDIITKMPQAPPFVEGVVEYRGKVIPLIDLRKRLSLPVESYSKETKVIVISTKEKLIGFIVNNVSEVLTTPISTISAPPPEVVNVDTQYIRGLGKGRITSRVRKRREEVKERMIILLDLEKIINVEGMFQIFSQISPPY